MASSLPSSRSTGSLTAKWRHHTHPDLPGILGLDQREDPDPDLRDIQDPDPPADPDLNPPADPNLDPLEDRGQDLLEDRGQDQRGILDPDPLADPNPDQLVDHDLDHLGDPDRGLRESLNPNLLAHPGPNPPGNLDPNLRESRDHPEDRSPRGNPGPDPADVPGPARDLNPVEQHRRGIKM